MFILKRITSEGLESNLILGESYHLVTKKYNTKYFFDTCKAFDFNDSKITGFIIYKDGFKAEPLYQMSNYWIMASDGNTFARIKNNKAQ